VPSAGQRFGRGVEHYLFAAMPHLACLTPAKWGRWPRESGPSTLDVGSYPVLVNRNRGLVPYVLVGILTLGAGLGAGLSLAAGPVTVTGTVTDAKPFCSGLIKVTEYVDNHQDVQNISIDGVRLFDKTFSHTVIPTAIANPISSAIAVGRRYVAVMDVVIAHHGSATNSQEIKAIAAYKAFALNLRTVGAWSKTNCAHISSP
jgi:hypothetical protein